MDRKRWVVAMLPLVLGSPAAAQDVLLRYQPPVGSQFQLHVWTEASTNITQTGDDPASAGIDLEFASLESVTRRVLNGAGRRYQLEVIRDSTHARVRAVGATWQSIPDTAHNVPSAMMTVDDRLRIIGSNDSIEGRPGVALLRGFAGGLEFTLPEEALAAGGSWSADVTFDVPRSLSLEGAVNLGGAVPPGATLSAKTTLTFDSLMVRATDTLAFVTIRGQVVPTTMGAAAEVAQGTVAISGALAGTMIWSSGWNAFVSGAIRMRVNMQVRVGVYGQESVSSISVSTDASKRFQVRP